MAVDAAVDALADLARQRGRLDIEANLSVSVDGRVFAVSSEADRLIVHAPSVGACLAVAPKSRLPALADGLDAAGVTVELRTGDAVLAVVGADADPGQATATLLSEGVEVRPSGVLAGLLRLR